MKTLILLLPMMSLLTAILGCGEGGKRSAEWTKSKKIAGSEQNLSHISEIVVDDKFAYVTIGGTIADQNEGKSGLRKIALDSGAVTNLENGENFPQSETGGMAIDEKYVYWNGGNRILRIAKDGGKPEIVASENVGIGIDLTIDNEKVYWTNHGYYSPNVPTKPSPVYSAPKKGGKTEIFADGQNVPGDVRTDEKFVYWHTAAGIYRQPKTGGQMQSVFQAGENEGVDKLEQDADSLYFIFRGVGESRWALRKIAKTGGEPQTLVKSIMILPFVVDQSNIYFFAEGERSNYDLCKIPKNGGEIVKLDQGYASGAITQGRISVYFGSLDDIYSVAKN